MEMQTRSERRKAVRRRNRAIVLTVGAAGALALVAGILLIVLGLSGADGAGASLEAEATSTASITLEETSTLAEADPAREVEVPDLVGQLLDEAQMLLAYAGFVPVVMEASDTMEGAAPGTVVRQDPVAGTLLQEGAEVSITVAPETGTANEPAQTVQEHFVVVIDPGHQATSDLDLEPNGPGSLVMKEKVRGGATGVSTRIPEYETVLQISLVLRDRLQEAGVEVVMTRTANDVDISNRQRAEIANRAGADLFVRVHCDGSGDPDVHGMSTLCPLGNVWVAPIESRSERAARIVQARMVDATGAADRGIVGRSDITGFNWSKVPAILVECGFLSNPAEDKLLSGDDYREKVAAGIATGVLEYLQGE